MQEKILITGATGYLGSRIAQLLADNEKATMVIPMRQKSTLSWGEQCNEWLKNSGINKSQVEFLPYDLEAEKPFAGLDQDSICDIYHNAAVTRFNVEEEVANKVNKEGSRKVFDFARQCPNLKGVHHASTVYVSGLRPGSISETILDRAEFANHYERSKWETEQLLTSEYSDLPWNIYRVATILCDDMSGVVTQQNAVHNTLKLIFYGLISLVPGKKNTPVYLVTGEFSARSIVELAQKAARHQVFHVCHKKEDSLCLEELIDLAFESFSKDKTFRSRGIKTPIC